jgi:excisionase family DNA binding protein
MKHNAPENSTKKQFLTDLPELVTVEEAATSLRLHIGTIRRQLNSGVLPGVRIGRGWRIRREDLLDLIQPPQSEQPAA